jgi:hypothetical protein
VQFVEKNELLAPCWINAGIYCLEREILESIPANGSVSLEKEVFPGWVGRGLFGYPAHESLLDIGIPEAYATAERFLGADAAVAHERLTLPPSRERFRRAGVVRTGSFDVCQTAACVAGGTASRPYGGETAVLSGAQPLVVLASHPR